MLDLPYLLQTFPGLPYLSIGANLFLTVVVIYVMRNNSKSSINKSTDEIITTVFKEAELKASFIVHDAAEKAKTIITEATTSRQEMEKSMKATFEEIFTTMKNQVKQESQAYSAHMQQTINEISGLLKQESLKMITELRVESKEQVKLFAQTMHEENKGIHNELLEQIKLEIDVIKNELQAYRDEEYKKIDQHLTTVLQTLLKEYLRDVLTYELNDELIFKALDKYKDANTTNVVNAATAPTTQPS
jgi:vacuolar-type H+-ATPase subunit H